MSLIYLPVCVCTLCKAFGLGLQINITTFISGMRNFPLNSLWGAMEGNSSIFQFLIVRKHTLADVIKM